MQPRYQYGTLTLRKRKKGPAVWQWRYLESGRRKSVLIGTLDRFPNKAAALRAAEPYRLKCNLEGPQASFHVTTIGGLVDRYVADELTRRDASGAERLRHNTQKSYLTFINNYIKPAWGDKTLDTVKPLTVEHWLDGIDRSRQTKAHIRNMFHVLFQYAMRVELTAHNPISLVRQSRLRTKAPRALTPQEFHLLLAKLEDPYKTMVLVAACLGLRVSELMGLQWGDIDWGNLVVRIRRSSVEGRIYESPKTEESKKPVPLDPSLAQVLAKFRKRASYQADSDFVFASDRGGSRCQGILLTDHIKPAAVRAGIGKIGWHTLRHTFATLLHDSKAPLAVQKELLRHADVHTTLNIYTQAVGERKRRAASRVVKMLLKK